MKQFLRKTMFALVGSMMFGSAALADTKTVGAIDNSSNAWVEFSDYYVIAPNKTLKLKFTNHTGKTENWHNWLVAITNNADRWNTEQGYFEYAVLRADNWAYQPGDFINDKGTYEKNTGAEKDPEGGNKGVTHNWYNAIRSNYAWETFKDDMDGSTVEMTIERMNAYVQIYAKITTATAKEYFEQFIIRCDDGKQTMRAFLTVEKAHIVIDNDATEITDTNIPEGLIGEIYNSTKGWTDFSDYYKLSKNQALTLEFENFSNKEQNWNNWVVGVTTNTNRWDWDGGYKEYFVLRNDNWETTSGSNTNITSNYNWDTFKDDMDGSTVKMTIRRIGADVKVRADITTAGGKEYFEEYTKACDDGEQDIRAWLMIEGGHLIMKSAAVTATISTYGWSTFSSDYALDFAKATEGLEAYMITGHEGNVVTLAKVTGTVPDGTGLLLKGTAGAEYNIPIVGSSATNVSANLLKAGTGATVSAESGKTTYVLGVNGGNAEFQKITTAAAATVERGKAYLVFNETISAPAMLFEGDITGISAIESAGIAEDGIYYNLSGQRVAQPTKGLYIVNGKKVIVKK